MLDSNIYLSVLLCHTLIYGLGSMVHMDGLVSHTAIAIPYCTAKKNIFNLPVTLQFPSAVPISPYWSTALAASAVTRVESATTGGPSSRFYRRRCLR